jgi:hypothetical protein
MRKDGFTGAGWFGWLANGFSVSFIIISADKIAVQKINEKWNRVAPFFIQKLGARRPVWQRPLLMTMGPFDYRGFFIIVIEGISVSEGIAHIVNLASQRFINARFYLR